MMGSFETELQLKLNLKDEEEHLTIQREDIQEAAGEDKLRMQEEDEEREEAAWYSNYQQAGRFLKAHPGDDGAKLFAAAGARDIASLQLLLDIGVNPHSLEFDSTVVHLAARVAYMDVLQCLIDNGADVEVQDGYKQTPLTVAAYQGHIDVVQFLLEAGADVNAGDSVMNMPLFAAVRNHRADVCRVLLAAGATFKKAKRGGETALHHAAAGRDGVEICTLLLDAGVEVDECDVRQRTALHWAARNGRLDAMSLLLRRGADRNMTDHFGLNPIDMIDVSAKCVIASVVI